MFTFSLPALAALGDVAPDFVHYANGGVLSTAVQPDGKIIIAGDFGTVEYVNRNGIARVYAEGGLDPTFNPIPNAPVIRTAVQADGKIVIAGGFSTVGGVPRKSLARLNADGSLDTGFDPFVDGYVYSMMIQADGKIVIGTEIQLPFQNATYSLVRLNADGTLDISFNPNPDRSVRSMTVQADGKFIIGGSFTTVDGTARSRVARLNADGTLDPGFDPDAEGTVLCTAVQADGKILHGGGFTTVGGVPRNCLARVNADGTLDTGFNPDPNSLIWSIGVQTDGKIIIGGYFAAVQGTARNGIARLNPDGTLDLGFNPNLLVQQSGTLNRWVSSTTVQANGMIVIGGFFIAVGETLRTNIARLYNNRATQRLAVTSTSRVEWLRGGTSPEAHHVTFELSTDGGTNWTSLGTGTRIPGGWELSGLSLPVTGKVRARARVTSGECNGSSGLVETVTAYSLASVSSPRLTAVKALGNGAFQFGFTNLSGGPFTALATTNLSLPSSNWIALGLATEISPGQFQFTDTAATNLPYRFYQIRSP
ncbi:MAG: hypothetical protein DME26_17940 [Verrucomicrobia bacterium]|nr:MAG: hypothetical protein DME26_17940 [Verrucomicrobiota bacterium]